MIQVVEEMAIYHMEMINPSSSMTQREANWNKAIGRFIIRHMLESSNGSLLMAINALLILAKLMDLYFFFCFVFSIFLRFIIPNDSQFRF